MLGTVINIVAILLGGTLGVLLGGRLPDRLRQTVMSGLGLFTLAIGLQMFLKTQNALIVLGSLVIGALLGEWWQVEEGLQNLGRWIERRVMRRAARTSQAGETAAAPQNPFVRGFFTASLLFCVGPMAILGSVQDGLTGNFQLLAVKSVLDGFTSIAFASSMGIGVLFSAFPVLVYQGGMTLAAALFQRIFTDPMMNEMTATGGVILIAIAISSILEIKPIRSGNFLPALFIAPALVALLAALGLS